MRTVAVVLNWRRPDETIACVRSLRAHAPAVEPVVVDNASGDASDELIAATLPDVTLLRTDRNRGYAGGNNVGIAAAFERNADAVLILNNDVVVTEGCVERLEAAARALKQAAIVAPLSLSAADPTRVDFFRARVDVANMSLNADGRGAPRRDVPLRGTIETDYATGSALYVEAQVLRALGGFDERFFLVWEDVDLCLRARRLGGRVAVVPSAEVLHHGSVSFGADPGSSPLYQYFFARNSFLMARKHLRWPRRWRTLSMIRRRYATWARTSDGAVAHAIERGLTDGVAGRFGPPPTELLPPGSRVPAA